jgi:hypothetical protein
VVVVGVCGLPVDQNDHEERRREAGVVILLNFFYLLLSLSFISSTFSMDPTPAAGNPFLF